MTALIIALLFALGVPLAFSLGKEAGASRVSRAVQELWDAEGGWIPGAAIGRLEKAIEQPLRTSQELRRDGVTPGYLPIGEESSPED